MKAALYLWKRRLRWVALLSVVLAVAMGVLSYLYLPVPFEAVAEVLMLPSDTDTLSALADEAVRWAQYDALKGNAETVQWNDADSRVLRYRNTGILLVKVRAADATVAAKGANALAGSLIEAVNLAAGEPKLKLVVQAGVPEKPILLYREKRIALGFAGVFLLLSMITFLFSVAKPKLIRTREIADAAGLPIVAETPDLRSITDAFLRFSQEDNPFLYDYAGYATHEQMRLLSLALRFRAKQDHLKSFAFVSKTDEEFRSETLVMLAQELCRQGSRVLLIDMNWYAPRLGLLLQAKGDRDLIHCLVSEIPFEQAVVQTETRNLYFLDQNHTQSMAAQLSASVSFSALLDAVYAKFDFVLFDMPRADLFSDALAITDVVHAYVPVIKAKRWTPKEVWQWLDPMHKLQRAALGTVVTCLPAKHFQTSKKLDGSAGI